MNLLPHYSHSFYVLLLVCFLHPLAVQAQESPDLLYSSFRGISKALSQDGSAERILQQYVAVPRQSVYDSVENRLYWADPETGIIWQADRKGSSIQPWLTSENERPLALTIDAAQRELYWFTVDVNFNPLNIWRASLDGSTLDMQPLDVFVEDMEYDPVDDVIYLAEIGSRVIRFSWEAGIIAEYPIQIGSP